MIEENKNNNNEIFDALPIPEDAVILKPKKVLDLSQLALLGIKEMTKIFLMRVNWLHWV